jgi:polyisoprenoid-binding protein YceI
MQSKNFNHVLPLIAALFICDNTFAQQSILPTQSEIVFVSRQMGVPVDGRFNHFSGQISLNPAKLESSSMTLIVDVGSATLGSPEADADLPKPDWFNAVKFPQATFKSNSIKSLGGAKFDVTGTLSVKGQTQSVVIPVALTQAGAITTASGNFTIKRLSFKVGENEWMDTSVVANDVQVKFKIALSGVAKV